MIGAAKSMKSTHQNVAAVAAELPQEIFMDILVRLPVKTLLRFRCVRKSWRCLISNPYFVRKHLNHTASVYQKNVENEYESAILCFSSSTTIFKSIEIYKKIEGNDNHNTPIMLSVNNVDFPLTLQRALMTGYCDGLYIVSHDNVFLWNPSIKKYRSLPPSGLKKCRFAIHGIGYDASVNDYKILRAPSILTATFFAHSVVEVFTLKTNSWKTIQDNFPYWIDGLCEHSFSAHGGIHWVGRRGSMGELLLICFDIVAENFWDVPLPSQGVDIIACGLQLFRGNPCVFQCHSAVEFHGGRQFDFWVMKEYGVGSSWTKLFTIPQIQELGNVLDPLWPFCFTTTGIILKCSSDFFLYNPRDGAIKRFSFGAEDLRYANKEPYVESLVSPFGGCSLESIT